MAILVWQQKGQWVRAVGDIIVDGIQLNVGKVSTLIDSGLWDATNIERYGLRIAAPFVAPDGEQPINAVRYEEIDGRVVEAYDTEPAPVQPYKLYKSRFIARLTEEEAATLELVLAEATAKLRLMFNSVEYFISDDPLFQTLKDAVATALKDPARADVLLGAD